MERLKNLIDLSGNFNFYYYNVTIQLNYKEFQVLLLKEKKNNQTHNPFISWHLFFDFSLHATKTFNIIKSEPEPTNCLEKLDRVQ